MTRRPGHEPGHGPAPGASSGSGGELPVGFDWASYLAELIDLHGSLAALAARLAGERSFAEDVGTVERGLRRLRGRVHHDGGVWGRRVLRAFGLPRRIDDRVRWMGQYHTRFTDLPGSVGRELLTLWDRPPVSESPARVWIQLGWTGIALRGRQRDLAREHLQRAGSALALRHAPARSGRAGNDRADDRPDDRDADRDAGPAARIEYELVSAYAAPLDADDQVAEHLEAAGRILESADARLSAADRACLHARWIDQRAYRLNKPRDGRSPDPAAALALYQSIPIDGIPDDGAPGDGAPGDGPPPFALCRRANGLAWSHFLLGDRDTAIAHARASVEHAGDGGSLRLRAMALNLLSRLLSGDEGQAAGGRALAIARRLEDEDLRLRIERRGAR